MSAETSTKKPKRVFEVALELKRTSDTIVEFLQDRGYDVTRNKMSVVTQDAYLELLQKFDPKRFSEFQSEQFSSREQEVKRDSERLRDEELDKIIKAKEESAPPSPPKKILLPKPIMVVVEPAPEHPSPAVEEKKSEPPVEIPQGEAAEKADVKTHVEEPVAESDKKPIADPVAEPIPKPIEDISDTPSVVEEKAEEAKPEVIVENKAVTPKKIELPKPKRLVIVEQAPQKVAPPPPPPSPQEVEESVQETKQKPEEKPKAEKTDDQAEKPAKKKRLRRKKPKVKVEPETVDAEARVVVPVLKSLEREGTKEKPTKVKPVDKGVSPPSKKKRKRGKTSDVPPIKDDAEKPQKGKKKRKISEEEISASIRETMAKISGRGKGKRRYTSTTDNVAPAEPEVVKLTEFVTTGELASLIDVPVQDLIRRCLEMGMMTSINQRLDRDTIELLAAEFECEVQFVQDEELVEAEEEPVSENLVKRPPVVTIMGHVDHGKTTLLDHLRHTRVAEGEVGGITQHIGAYEIVHNGEKISFLDTPGHEAFTAMRARGAQITDLVVLVVAADDKVMPQTLEAIDHARAAGTPIIVAVNKVDKPSANPEAIYKQLADHNILVEKWGGKYQSAEISAKFGQGVDDLLAEILVAAEILDLKADPTMRARGVVVESRLDKGLGAVTTVLVQNGTLRPGDNFVVGQYYGRVRALYDERGETRDEAGPASPVQVVGVNGVPQSGDKITVYATEKETREIAQRRQRQQREISMRQIKALSLDSVSRRMREQSLQELPLIIKGDVHGSVEVLSDALLKLSNSEVKVNIIHRGVGAITESDVLLAAASGAIIIGYHVHPNLQAKDLARREGVEIRLYRILYEVVDQIKKSLEGLLTPLQEEHVIGTVDVRKTYKISKLGTIAGCFVLDGKVARNSKVRLIRDGVEIWSGNISGLKRVKDDAREVVAGYECGISLDGYRDIKVGDQIQAYEIIETARKLESAN